MLTLYRPLAILDLETTGTNTAIDRIIQIAMIKIGTDGQTESEAFSSYVDPTVPIPDSAVAVHGLTNARLSGAQTFEQVAPRVVGFLDGCDIAGYNVAGFDLPLLKNELQRAGLKLRHEPRVIDVYRIYRRQEPQTLEAAVRWYVGADPVGAHDATADVDMTRRVLMAQAERYEASTIDDLEDLSKDPSWIDINGRLRLENGEVVMGFGKWDGVALSDVESGYLKWMARQDFDSGVLAYVLEELEHRGREQLWQR